jgi:ATP-dependent protease ClpP protease subunit
MDAYIKFYAQVNQNTVIQLQRQLEQALLQGMKTLHLLLSTPGGSVHDGISVYNLLKGLPIDVKTYNFGSVDSIGVVMFCAGSERFSVPHARFLLHPVAMQVLQATTLDEPSIEEKLKLVKADQSNIAKVISATINKPVEDVQKLIHARTTLEPDKALEKGLVTEIKSSLIPAGVHLISIYDNQMQQQIGMPGLQIPLQIPIRGIVQPGQQGITSISNSFTTI